MSAVVDTSAQAFDWNSPAAVAGELARRADMLDWVRAHAESLTALRAHYAKDPASFIDDWGVTVDPRAPSRGLPAAMPFKLFPAQRELVAFILSRMERREPGIVEKARDLGASWVVMALAATLCMFRRDVAVLIGSQKEAKIDNSTDPSSLFWKLRAFMQHVPPEFRGAWDETRCCSHMKASFVDTGSSVFGEAGDQLGRGARATLALIDEAAFLERPHMIDAALASTTETRIDVSTPNGRANSFAEKRFSGRIEVYSMPWYSDPRKDQAWYEKQRELLDPVTFAQEIDLSYDASAAGLLIPPEWIRAAIDAHVALGFGADGAAHAALDVADEGRDFNALTMRRGVVLESMEQWTGKGSDMFRTTMRAFASLDASGRTSLTFDSDGLGSAIRGDAVEINARRAADGKHEIAVTPFRGSGAVGDPHGSMVEGRKNADFFANAKSQSWWALRLRFQNTFRAREGLHYNPDDLISIPSELPNLQQLLAELVQPKYSLTAAGRVQIDKAPAGTRSPNLADSLMMLYSPFVSGTYTAPTVETAAHVVAPGVLAGAMPKNLDYAYCVISVANAALGAVFFGTQMPSIDSTSRGHGTWALDWDLTEISPYLGAWIEKCVYRLQELHDECGCRVSNRTPLFIDDPAGGFSALLAQQGFGFEALPKDFPLISERAALVQPYVMSGAVRLAPPASERQCTYRAATRNFLREALEAPLLDVEHSPLASAFATAVLVTFKDRPATVTRDTQPKPAQPPAPEEIPPSHRGPHDHLAPGKYIVDGKVLIIPQRGGLKVF